MRLGSRGRFGEFLGSKRCGTLADASEHKVSPLANLPKRDLARRIIQCRTAIAPCLSFGAEAERFEKGVSPAFFYLVQGSRREVELVAAA